MREKTSTMTKRSSLKRKMSTVPPAAFTQVTMVITDLSAVMLISNTTNQLTLTGDCLPMKRCNVRPGSLLLVAVSGVNQLNGLYVVSNSDPCYHPKPGGPLIVYRTLSFDQLVAGQLFFDACTRALYQVKMVTSTGASIELLVPRIPCDCDCPRETSESSYDYVQVCSKCEYPVSECRCYRKKKEKSVKVCTSGCDRKRSR